LSQNTKAGTFYLLDNIVIDNTSSTFMNCSRALHSMVNSLYNIAERNLRSDSGLITNPSIQKSRHKRPRIPDRGSFYLNNPNVNFNAIHARLTDGNNPFIDPMTSRNNLIRVFSGLNITEKVIWYNANSLRYFIRGLHQRNLIEKVKEGIWRRTVACFSPEQGEFKQKDFKDTKDPTASVTLLLDEVIRLFSA